MIAQFFINRPVLANVIAWVLVLIGAVSLFGLPVAQYPQLTPPTIQVTAFYPGASALTVQQLVAHPIEQQLFDGHPSIQQPVFGFKHGGKTALSQFADNLIFKNALARF